MANRHNDALGIQKGACNPHGITRSLIEALDEARQDPTVNGTRGVCYDPAVRLIVHQLAYICGINEIERTPDTYGRLMRECEAAAKPQQAAE
jgi:hypothetical protein